MNSNPIKIAVVGYGNIGKYAIQAARAADDFALAGIISRSLKEETIDGVPVVRDIARLEKPDAAALCVPSRSVRAQAEKYLSLGINTVDSFDIHSDILSLKKHLQPIATANGAVAIISAGWDPGLDSVMRALFLMAAPRGITYTDFGPGMSMGHTVAAKSAPGVDDALSITIPKGYGVHRRMVYVKLQQGADFSAVAAAIKNDPYFVNDETHVIQTEDIAALMDKGHGVTMRRKAGVGGTDNQMFEFNMRINNPALTAQILIASARAAAKMPPGCYTMLDIPPAYYLPGCPDGHVAALV